MSRAAVRDEDDGGALGGCGVDRRAQGAGLLRQCRRGTVWVVGVQPRQGDGGDVVAAVAEVGGDGLPGPGAEPEAGDQNDGG
jgi:hypothetical protein